MLWTPRLVRLVAVGAGVGVLGIAFAVRGLADGALEQHSGTLLYGSLVYLAVLFCRTRGAPLVTAAIAIGFCWLVECAQLTGIPAELSARSLLARLVLGAQFDPTDLAWYPVGVVPLVAVHWLLAARARHRGRATERPVEAERPLATPR
ncbi:DUF2809 domain-containing protein [Plantactinospora solaniradicis]|uniref:DUF2809 domain-containing protein n=1 Tax=Plantactinospora solaniradicis TaxID=1723736 RepID=A0ABW1K7N8_9ACTN